MKSLREESESLESMREEEETEGFASVEKKEAHLWLEKMKKVSSSKDVLYIIENTEIMRFLIYWQQAPISFNKGLVIKEAEIWSCCLWSLEDTAMYLGGTEAQTLFLYNRAKEMGLIYPDGSIPESASKLLELFAKNRMLKLQEELVQHQAGLEEAKAEVEEAKLRAEEAKSKLEEVKKKSFEKHHAEETPTGSKLSKKLV